MRSRLLVCVLVLALFPFSTARAATQNDVRSGTDAGDTFASATKVTPRGWYTGRLDVAAGDTHDFVRFYVPRSRSMSVLVEVASGTDPVELLDPEGRVVDTGVAVQNGFGVAASDAFTEEPGAMRLAVHRALVEGDYRLHISAERNPLTTYRLCFMNCDEPMSSPIELIFGGSLRGERARVLLVPPSHGDLTNLNGPTVLDYIDATLRGMHRWTAAARRFANDHPQFGYLRRLDVDVTLFDEDAPVDPSGFDVIVVYVAAGPAFRGSASQVGLIRMQDYLGSIGSGDQSHISARVIALSLFGAAPRAGQVAYDFPEVNDLENVTMHEFAHTFGVGHTRYWHATRGADLMNSPASFVYGDGSPLGDGGERTKLDCVSNLDLYALAHLYRWLPSGHWAPSDGWVSLPEGEAYRLYC